MSEKRIYIKRYPFFVNTIYGLGDWLKDYAYYPQRLPLYSYMDHGISLSDKISPHEIHNNAPLILKFSPRLVRTYKNTEKKPVYNLLNPAIHCRRKLNISRVTDAKGSLFFVAHTTRTIDDLTDWDTFIEHLRKIPSLYHPVDICLHPADIEKGLDYVFRERGFSVISADTDYYSKNFMENFYYNLKKYRFALSNLIGSYTFYAVEMGIPFSLYGDEPKYFNKGDNNVELGLYNSYKEQPTYQKAKKLFDGLHTTITEEQAYFVDYELGKLHTISRLKACYLLYKAYLLYTFRYRLTPRKVVRFAFNFFFRKPFFKTQ